MVVKRQLPDGWEPLTEPLSLEALAFVQMPSGIPKIRRATALPAKRPDAVNLLALAADALTGLLPRDDGQLVDALIGERYGVPHGEIAVEVLS